MTWHGATPSPFPRNLLGCADNLFAPTTNQWPRLRGVGSTGASRIYQAQAGKSYLQYTIDLLQSLMRLRDCAVANGRVTALCRLPSSLTPSHTCRGCNHCCRRALRGLALLWSALVLVVARTQCANADPVHARGTSAAVGLQITALGQGRSRDETENARAALR